MPTISNLPAVTDVVSTDEYVLMRAGVTNKIDASDLIAGISTGGELDYAQITSDVSVTSSTEATPTNVISGNAVAYDGSTRIRIEMWAMNWTSGAGSQCLANLWDGSTDLGRIGQTSAETGATARNQFHAVVFLTPSAGSHTYHWKAWRTVANALIAATSPAMPAFMQITRA